MEPTKKTVSVPDYWGTNGKGQRLKQSEVLEARKLDPNAHKDWEAAETTGETYEIPIEKSNKKPTFYENIKTEEKTANVEPKKETESFYANIKP